MKIRVDSSLKMSFESENPFLFEIVDRDGNVIVHNVVGNIQTAKTLSMVYSNIYEKECHFVGLC